MNDIGSMYRRSLNYAGLNLTPDMVYPYGSENCGPEAGILVVVHTITLLKETSKSKFITREHVTEKNFHLLDLFWSV